MSGKLFACVLGLFLVLGAGCVGSKGPDTKALMDGTFVLMRVDGEPFTSDLGTPELGFGEGLRVYGGFCNRFMGQATLVGSTLTVPEMASTRMLCHEEALNELESSFFQMLAAGAELTFADRTLTLHQGGRTLTYVRGGWGSTPR